MSGIEVAGLVFGAFPLVLSALEHYRDAATVLEIFWRFKREYKLWVHDLRICEVAFERNLEYLLLPLVVDDDEVQKLLKTPGGLGWKDPDLEVRLKQRLSKSYLLYLERIGRIQEIMEKVKEHLGVDKLGLSEDTDVRSDVSLDGVKANLDYQARRIRMSLSKSKRENLFQQLTKGNDELRDLLDSSDRSAALWQSRGVAKRTTEAKAMWQFWRHTDRLYKLLARSWLCDCKRFHFASLLLQHRTSPTTLDFRIFFFFGDYNETTEQSWSPQEATIKMLKHDGADRKLKERSVVKFAPDPIQPPAPTPTTPTPSPPPPAALGSPPPRPSSSPNEAPKEVQKKSLKGYFRGKLKRNKGSEQSVFDGLLASPQVIQPPKNALSTDNVAASANATAATSEIPEPPQLLVTNVDGKSSPGKAESERMIDIINLCSEIPNFSTGADDGRPFCLKDDHCRVALNPVYHPKDPATTSAAAQNTISLEALLRKDTPRALTRRERYLIALTLASSYLQLKSSPWIRLEWSKRDILFLWAGANPSRIRLDQPYISQHFGGADVTEDSDDDDTVMPMGRFDRNDRTLVNLGIMLLELCFGTALEEHAARRRHHSMSRGEADGAAVDHYLDMAAALEWSPHAAEEAGPEFADAIDWCLRYRPGSGESDGKLDRWREELFGKVVQPLKCCYDQFVVAKG